MFKKLSPSKFSVMKNYLQSNFRTLSIGFLLIFGFSIMPNLFLRGQCPPGSVYLLTQADVNAFATAYPNCTTINGTLGIGRYSPPSDISDLAGLQNITTVTESVEIRYTYTLASLNGLNNLSTIGSHLRIRETVGLTSLSGLDNISSVAGDFMVQMNEHLTSLNGLNSLSYIGQGMFIQNCPSLTSLEGLNNLNAVSGWEIRIENNNLLTSLDALSNLNSIGGCRLTLISNQSLQSIQGLENIDPTSIDNLVIGGHPLLSECAIQSICGRITDPNNPASVSICCNATGCNSEQEVEALCDTPPSGCTNAFQWPQFAYPLNNNSAPITISDCTWEGDYSEIPDAVAGMTLQFTSTAPNGIITIRAGTPEGPVLAFSPLPLTFDNTFTGPIYAHWNLPNCGTAFICRTTTVQCLNCDPPLPNDVCEGAIPLFACDQALVETTYGARSDFPGIPLCGSDASAQGVWYSFVGTGNDETISLLNANFDATIRVYNGSCGNLTCASSNSNGNQVTVTTVAGTTYYVLVNGSTPSEYGGFTIKLLDSTPPTVVCKDHSVELSLDGTATIEPSDVFEDGADNCTEVELLLSVSPYNFDCSNIGENTVTLTVADEEGNTATCTAIVTVAPYPNTSCSSTLTIVNEVINPVGMFCPDRSLVTLSFSSDVCYDEWHVSEAISQTLGLEGMWVGLPGQTLTISLPAFSENPLVTQIFAYPTLNGQAAWEEESPFPCGAMIDYTLTSNGCDGTLTASNITTCGVQYTLSTTACLFEATGYGVVLRNQATNEEFLNFFDNGDNTVFFNNLPSGTYTVWAAALGVTCVYYAPDLVIPEYLLWYSDTDNDGAGDPNNFISACEQPSGYVNNASDNCPNDPNKTNPMQCGCGEAETDSDSDGTADCNDGCPYDSEKTAPGTCGCGVADTDTDGDGTLDCNDGCPNDPNSTAPGQCGCGVPEVDSDGDGTANCIDGCPNDPNKVAYGICGCGVSDADTDGDGTVDCHDDCPNDPNKVAPGVCGCGVPDVDNDNDGSMACDDCNDNDATIFPGADEVCGNSVDEDCDLAVDEGCCTIAVSLPACRTVYFGYAPAASTTLASSVSGANGTTTYAWSNGGNTASITVSPAITTTYTVTVTDASNCTATASVLVEAVDVTCGNNNDKVLICHVLNNGNSNTLCLAENPAAIHLAHGDALGECGIQVCEPYQPTNNQIQGPASPHHHVAEAERLLVYPNPAGREVTIVMEPNPLVTQLSIENALGIRVLLEKVSPDTERHTIDVSNLPPGLYFISTEGKLPVQFVKQ